MTANTGSQKARFCRNEGDLPGFGASFRAGFIGQGSPSVRPVGVVAPGATVTQSFSVAAPGVPGTANFRTEVDATAYGEDASTGQTVAIVVQSPTGGGGGGGSTGPTIAASGVLHGASFTAGFTAGGWVTILGTNLSSTTRIWQGSDFVGGQLPTSLDGVSVTINNRPAFIYFISPTQINALAPDDPKVALVPVQVKNSLGSSAAVMANKFALAPAFSLFDAGGRRYPTAVHPDGSFVAPTGLFPPSVPHRPVRPGDVILLYGTGCGPTNPPTPTDRILTAAAPLARPVSATAGASVADVQYAGLAGSGLCQFNVKMPTTLPDGDAQIVLRVDGVASPIGVFIPIRR